MNAIEVELQRLRQEVAQLRGQVQRLDGRPVSFSPKLVASPSVSFVNSTDPAETIPPYAVMVCRQGDAKGTLRAYKPGHTKFRFFPGGWKILFNGAEEVAPGKVGAGQAGPVFTCSIDDPPGHIVDPGSTYNTEKQYRWQFLRPKPNTWNLMAYHYQGYQETDLCYCRISPLQQSNSNLDTTLIEVMHPNRPAVSKAYSTEDLPTGLDTWAGDGPHYITPFIPGFGPLDVGGMEGIKRPYWDMTDYAVTATVTLLVDFASETQSSPPTPRPAHFEMKLDPSTATSFTSFAWGTAWDPAQGGEFSYLNLSATCLWPSRENVGATGDNNDRLLWSIRNIGTGSTLANGDISQVRTLSVGLSLHGVTEPGKLYPVFNDPGTGPTQPGTGGTSALSSSMSFTPEEALPGEGGTGEAPGGMEGPATPGPIEPL